MLDIIKKYSTVGQLITVYLDSGSVTGCLEAVDEQGVLLKTSTGMRYLKATKIDDFEVLDVNQVDNAMNQNLPVDSPAGMATTKSTPLPQPILTAEAPQKGICSTEPANTTQKVISNTVSAIEKQKEGQSAENGKINSSDIDFIKLSFEKFESHPALAIPDVDFSTLKDVLEKEDYEETNRYKNKYDYALKVRETSRIVNFIPQLLQLADSIKNKDLYFLCGILSFQAQIKEKAKTCITNAFALGHPKAAVLLAKFAEETEEWQTAVEFLVHTLVHDKHIEKTEKLILLNLGHFLSHLEDKEVKGLASIQIHENNRKVANSIWALALFDKNKKVALMMINDQLAEASQVNADSEIFSPPPDLKKSYCVEIQGETGKKQSASESFESNLISLDENIGIIFGHISNFYPDKDCGFITSNINENFFFHLNQVADEALKHTLKKNRTGQKVSFLRRPLQHQTSLQRYDHADKVQRIDTDDDLVPVEKKKQPIDSYSYAEGKTAEQRADLEQAEKIYSRIVKQKDKRWESAVKDLASILNRSDRCDEAVELLDKHRNEVKDPNAIDNLKVDCFIKARRFNDAVPLLRAARKRATPNTRAKYINRESYCMMMDGDIGGALDLLQEAQEDFPNETHMQVLIDRLQALKLTGGVKSLDEEELEGLFEISSGLSSFAQELIKSCDFFGVDERAKAKGFYVKRDFTEVDKNFDRIGGRRPKEKSKLLLTLAAMVDKSPDEAGRHNLQTLLARSLSFRAEAATYDSLNRDTIRFYLAEAIGLIKSKQEKKFDVRFPLSFLIASYFKELPEPAQLLKQVLNDPKSRDYDAIYTFNELSEDPEELKRFLDDLPYYCSFTENALDSFLQFMKKENIDVNLESAVKRIQKELKDESIHCKRIWQLKYNSVSIFQDAAQSLMELQVQTRFGLDKERYKNIADLEIQAAKYWNEKDYIEKESKCDRIVRGIDDLLSDIHKEPTKLSFEQFIPILANLSQAIIANFDSYKKSTNTELSLSNLLSDDFYVPDNKGFINLKLELRSVSGGVPVEGIDVYARPENGLELRLPATYPAVFRGGDRQEIELQVKPSQSQINEQAFSIKCYISYRTRMGEQATSEDFIFPIRINQGESFELINNPYATYSGGKSVGDPSMFKGREDVLQNIADKMNMGDMGQCFVMYGQKRSGKTSILKQLKHYLNEDCYTIVVSLGSSDVDTEKKQISFVQDCVDEITFELREKKLSLPDVPSSREIKDNPSSSFKKTMRQLRNTLISCGFSANPRLLLLVDEFTYVYEYIKEGIVSKQFMRNWKAMLEMQLFNAVVVGQDSMPKFKEEFSNEFGVTYDERISYLAESEARKLAEEPILYKGKSRYRGHALKRLHNLTAGSPFFTNIICDRLVHYLNDRKAPFVTEADIDAVLYGWKDSQNDNVSGIVSGSDPLPLDKFDGLITAAGEAVADFQRQEYLDVLTAIAVKVDGAFKSDLPTLYNLNLILKDMHDREIITSDASNRYFIRVGLFAEWLRKNYDYVTAGEKGYE